MICIQPQTRVFQYSELFFSEYPFRVSVNNLWLVDQFGCSTSNQQVGTVDTSCFKCHQVSYSNCNHALLIQICLEFQYFKLDLLKSKWELIFIYLLNKFRNIQTQLYLSWLRDQTKSCNPLLCLMGQTKRTSLLIMLDRILQAQAFTLLRINKIVYM